MCIRDREYAENKDKYDKLLEARSVKELSLANVGAAIVMEVDTCLLYTSVLGGVNAKFAHTNPAIRYLQQYCGQEQVQIAEYTRCV